MKDFGFWIDKKRAVFNHVVAFVHELERMMRVTLSFISHQSKI
jgi:hypothetical protein